MGVFLPRLSASRCWASQSPPAPVPPGFPTLAILGEPSPTPGCRRSLLSGSSVSGLRGYPLSRLLSLSARHRSRLLGIPQPRYRLSPVSPLRGSPPPQLGSSEGPPKPGFHPPASTGRSPREHANNGGSRKANPHRGSRNSPFPRPSPGLCQPAATRTTPKKPHLSRILRYPPKGHFRLSFGVPEDPKILLPEKLYQEPPMIFAASSASPVTCGMLRGDLGCSQGGAAAVTMSCGLVAPPFPAPAPGPASLSLPLLRVWLVFFCLILTTPPRPSSVLTLLLLLHPFFSSSSSSSRHPGCVCRLGKESLESSCGKGPGGPDRCPRGSELGVPSKPGGPSMC